MLINKSIKKFILLSLFIVLPVQTMTMPSWLFFSNIKKNVEQLFLGVNIAVFKNHKTAVAIIVGVCVAAYLGVLYQKVRREAAEVKREAAEAKASRVAAKAKGIRAAVEKRARKAEEARLTEQEKKALERLKGQREIMVLHQENLKKAKKNKVSEIEIAKLTKRAAGAKVVFAELMVQDAGELLILAEEERRKAKAGQKSEAEQKIKFAKKYLTQQQEKEARKQQEFQEVFDRGRLAKKAKLAEEALRKKKEAPLLKKLAHQEWA